MLTPLIATILLLLGGAPLNDAASLQHAQVKLSNGTSFAHGCPIGPDVLLTNTHVARDSHWDRYETIYGQQGRAEVVAQLSITDLARLLPDPPLREWYSVAKECPKIGDKLYHLGYEKKDKGHLLWSRPVETTLVGFFAGELVYSGSGGPGSSGSCVLNEKGEVVGINEAMLLDDPVVSITGVATQPVLGGLGVAICGEWEQELELLATPEEEDGGEN